MVRNNSDLSLIGEPPCWGSGEIPLFPSSWASALSEVDLIGVVDNLGNAIKSSSNKTFATRDLCGNDWVGKFRKLNNVDNDLQLCEAIISVLSKEFARNANGIDVPILDSNLAGVSGGAKLPFRVETRDALVEANQFSDQSISELLSGTYLELFERFNDLSIVLDLAITATAWLKNEGNRQPTFALPEISQTLNGTFRAMRMRSIRNMGYSPESNWYSSNFADVLGKRFGLDWQGKWSLEECGQDLDVTGERVRQIENEVLVALSPRQWGETPVLNKLCIALLSNTQNDFSFTDDDDRVLYVNRDAAEKLLYMFGYGKASYQNVNTSKAAQSEFGQSIVEMRRMAYQFSGKIGFVIEENLQSHFDEVYGNFDDLKFGQVKPLIVDSVDLPHGYIYVESRSKSFFLSWTQNILSLQGDLQFDEFFEASNRYCSYRLPGVVHPPRAVIRAWFEGDKRFTLFENGDVGIIEPCEVELGDVQIWLRDEIISSTGCVMHRAELMDRAREAGVNSTSIGIYCSYERYFKPVDAYCVTLTGVYPIQESIDLAYMRANGIKIETKIHSFEIANRRVNVFITAGSNLCNQGFWSFTRALKAVVGASNFDLIVDGENVGRSTYFGSTSTAWTSALAALGVVPGDKIKIVFDNETLKATLELLADSSVPVDAD